MNLYRISQIVCQMSVSNSVANYLQLDVVFSKRVCRISTIISKVRLVIHLGMLSLDILEQMPTINFRRLFLGSIQNAVFTLQNAPKNKSLHVIYADAAISSTFLNLNHYSLRVIVSFPSALFIPTGIALTDLTYTFLSLSICNHA